MSGTRKMEKFELDAYVQETVAPAVEDAVSEPAPVSGEAVAHPP